MLANAFRLLTVLRQVLRLPAVRVSLGDSSSTYRSFTRRHPRYGIIAYKRWGVALLSIPAGFEAYLKGKDRQAVRTNRNKALKAGYGFLAFHPLDHLDDILAINTSSTDRQGKPMAPEYCDVSVLRSYFHDKPSLYGITDRDGKVIAYAYVPIHGELCVFSRLLGHAEHLDQGVMYLLISEVIREMSVLRMERGKPLWAMYDTYFGGASGLRYFKTRLGFSPYKVKWVLDKPKHWAGCARWLERFTE